MAQVSNYFLSNFSFVQNFCVFYPFTKGIALEDQANVFRQFTQFNPGALQGGGGSGLGLWICRNLATLHGGRLVF